MNGVVVIDKPPGWTSFDVVRDVKRALNVKKAGHAGTLDPIATGVLPVCLDEATKLVTFFSTGDKEYRATILLGVETDTLDREGRVIARRVPAVTKDEIVKTLGDFTGVISQEVPRYSAVKHKGKPLYWWTRRGVDIDPPSREVRIHEIECEDLSLPYVTIRVVCSKGTYIRSLAADIGKRLACGATLFALRRIRSGCFTEDLSLKIETMKTEEKGLLLKGGLISMADAMPMFPAVVVDSDAAERLRQGIQPTVSMMDENTSASLEMGDVIKFITFADEVVAIAKMLVPSAMISSLSNGVPVARIERVFLDAKEQKSSDIREESR